MTEQDPSTSSQVLGLVAFFLVAYAVVWIGDAVKAFRSWNRKR